jgi:hypothetical protein
MAEEKLMRNKEIAERVRRGHKYEDIAHDYGITKQRVHQIVCREGVGSHRAPGYLLTLHRVTGHYYAAAMDGRIYEARRVESLNAWSATADGAFLGLHSTLPAARRQMETHLVGQRRKAA